MFMYSKIVKNKQVISNTLQLIALGVISIAHLTETTKYILLGFCIGIAVINLGNSSKAAKS
jgi:hypothetical protein